MILAKFPNELIIVFVFVGLVLLSFIGLFFLAKRIRDMVFNKRYDDNGTLKYFYCEDFPNLENEEIEFISEKNLIKGYIYKDSTFEDYKGVIVFAHGLGVGHNQYTTEINHFAKLGFLVVSYDVSGTGKSEGKTLKGISTALFNLRDCLSFVEKHPILYKYKKMVIGHSMGGYACNNITRYNQDLVGVISMSSFDTTYGLLSDEIALMNGMEIKALKVMFKLLERLNFSKEGLFSSLDAFKNTDIKHLIISADKDNIVDISKNHLKFEEELKDKDNFKFLLIKDRYHRPNISIEAAKYDQETNIQLQELKREYKNNLPKDIEKEYYENLNYDLLVELDEEVMSKIDEFILECFK